MHTPKITKKCAIFAALGEFARSLEAARIIMNCMDLS